jgi:hypothetical protein
MAVRCYSQESHEVCPAPQKLISVWLRVQPHVRKLDIQCRKPLPRDSPPNRNLLKRAGGDTPLASMRSTIFVRQLLHQPQAEGATIARVVLRCREAEYRVGESNDCAESSASLLDKCGKIA